MAKRQAPPADPKEPESRVRITDFAGMSPGTDLHDNDPGESWYQVNVVPFHPGELRVRRGFVVCQFDPGPSVSLVAPPLVRYAEAASSIWIHSDARRGRDIEVSVWEKLVVTAHQPTSNFHSVQAFGRLVLESSASAYTGNLNELSASYGAYNLSGETMIPIVIGTHGQSRMAAMIGVYPAGAAPVSGVFNSMLATVGAYNEH